MRRNQNNSGSAVPLSLVAPTTISPLHLSAGQSDRLRALAWTRSCKWGGVERWKALLDFAEELPREGVGRREVLRSCCARCGAAGTANEGDLYGGYSRVHYLSSRVVGGGGSVLRVSGWTLFYQGR